MTVSAVRYLGSFPERDGNSDLLNQLETQQKANVKFLGLLEVMSMGEDAESIYEGCSI